MNGQTPGSTGAVPEGASLISSVAANLTTVRHRIEEAGGDLSRIILVAVTKGFGIDAVHAATEAGIWDLGDNYAQELRGKIDLLKNEAGAKADHGEMRSSGTGSGPIRWHFLGPVQQNKVAALAGSVDWWHSVDRLAIGEAIARRRPGAHVLVQVNTTGETTKHGCMPEETEALVARLRTLPLDVAGLMTIGPLGTPEEARPGFRLMAQLGRRLGLRELSMGMTGDLEVAIQEGATMVRIGRALFGPRDRMASPATVGSWNGGD